MEIYLVILPQKKTGNRGSQWYSYYLLNANHGRSNCSNFRFRNGSRDACYGVLSSQYRHGRRDVYPSHSLRFPDRLFRRSETSGYGLSFRYHGRGYRVRDVGSPPIYGFNFWRRVGRPLRRRRPLPKDKQAEWSANMDRFVFFRLIRKDINLNLELRDNLPRISWWLLEVVEDWMSVEDLVTHWKKTDRIYARDFV